MYRDKSNINKEILKHKRTYGIDKDVIEKAKAAGINVSSIMEKFLKTMTYELKNDGGDDDNNNNGNTRHDVARAYEALFHEAWRVLIQYDQTGSFNVDVGNWQSDWEKKVKTVICFNSQRGLAVCYDVPLRPIVEPDVPVDKVLEAIYEYGLDKILENLLVALTRAAEANKAIITRLKFAKQLVKTLSDKEEEEVAATDRKRRDYQIE
jgi:post-segregation antitoxin (ccd killing protein)